LLRYWYIFHDGIVTEAGSEPAAYRIGCRHAPLCYRCHRSPPEIIQHAIWLYLRFTMSYRDVEELLAERGLDISYETVRRWVLKFGPAIARRLRQRRPRPSDRWHLDEMLVRIAGERMYLWRAVDDEGEVLDMLVQRRRDSRAALRLMRKLLKKQGFPPKLLVTCSIRPMILATV
jgi:putative transposase